MPITALSQKTKELLGSTSVITTPFSLVKELIDNAIDASANTIEVLISPDTVTKVEVRDDGVGIHPDDYDSLGRRGHTSKLRNFEDLQTLAGNTLGFRGEALASANTVGKLTITTKTTSDPVAAVLQINPNDGGILKQQCGSAPAGTTVSVAQLYHGIPVRKQSVIKEAKRTLERIKVLFRSYAMARPKMRFTFRVIGKPNLTWIYAPKQDASYSEVILQILGKDAASRCIEKTASFPAIDEGQQQADPAINFPKASYDFSASLWRPGIEVLQLPRHRYFSVDGRPVTATKGAMQKLVSIYAKYLGNALHDPDSTKAICDPFIRVDIQCSKGSYDVNIEPAKDQVLFEDEPTVIRCFETLCQELYKPFHAVEKGDLSKTQMANTSQPIPCKPSNIPNSSQFAGSSDAPRVETILHSAPTRGGATTSWPTEELTAYDRLQQPVMLCQSSQAWESSAQRGPTTTFPTIWTAINAPAPIQKSGSRVSVPLVNNDKHSGQEFDALRIILNTSEGLDRRDDSNQRRQLGTFHQEIPPDLLPIREPSSPSGRPLDSWSFSRMNVQAGSWIDTNISRLQISSQTELRAASITPEPELLRHRDAPPRDLDVPPSMRNSNWHGNNIQIPNTEPSGLYQSPKSSPVGHKNGRLGISRHCQAQPPWTPPLSVQKDQEQRHDRYVSKFQPSSSGLKQTTLTFSKPQLRRKPRDKQVNEAAHESTDMAGRQGVPPCYQNEFSTARQTLEEQFTAALHQKVMLQASTTQGNSSNKKNTCSEDAFTGLQPTSFPVQKDIMADKEPIFTSLPTEDPRAYLLRRQKSKAADESMGRPKRFKRVKSVLLPLENTSVDDRTLDVSLPVRLDIQRLPASLNYFRIYDKYIVESDFEFALDMDIGEARRIERRLDALLSNWSQSIGERVTVESNLSSVLRGKGAEVRV